jgi:dihydropteroate synthase type 2
VNLTTDSFSDGGRFRDPDAATAHALQLMADGADAIDLGAAASNPRAASIEPAEEIRRLAPVVARLLPQGVPLSVDSFQPAVQRWALAEGVAYLNDTRGFPDPSLYPQLVNGPSRLIVMHAVQKSGTADRTHVDPAEIYGRVVAFFETRLDALERAGIARTRCILDPGMGFFLGSVTEASLVVLRHVGELRRRFGLPVLVSVSRKSFLGTLTGRPVGERGPATLAAEVWAVRQGVDWIRTHDVRALRDALAVLEAVEVGR